MQKLLYVSLLCFVLYTNSAHSMFKRRANSDQTDKRTALVAPPATKPQHKSSESNKVDISEQLRQVLKIDNNAYFNRKHRDDEEEDEDESEEDDEDTTSSRDSLRSAFEGKPVALLLPSAVEPIAQPPKILRLLTETEKGEPEVVAAVNSKELELGRKLALLKTAPLDQVQLINVPGTDEATPRMKQFFMCKLRAADDAVTIDDSDSNKPQVIIDLNKYFTSASDLASSQEQDIRQHSQSPPARYVSLSDGEENDDEDSQEKPQAQNSAKSSQKEPQVQNPYADRHTLGLKLEWLNKLPQDQIDVINFDPFLTAEEQSVKKQELIALLASTAIAVNTNLDDDNFDIPRLIIDVSKLVRYSAITAKASEHNAQPAAQTVSEQHSKPQQIQENSQSTIIKQPSLLQKLGIPIATGLLCFTLGYLFAKGQGAYK